MNAVLKPQPTFARERCADVIDEIKPILEKHYREIAHYQDIPLAPDWDRYWHAEKTGALRIFTVRNPSLVGYAIYAVAPALHYSTSLQASQDVLYLDPACRRGRLGWGLIQFADEQLRAEGVQVVYQHVKKAHSFGPLLERMGYELIDLIYARRLS